MVTMKDMELEAERGCNIFDAADQLRDYVYGLSEVAFDRDKAILTDRESVEQRKEYVREHFLEAIGGLPEKSSEIMAESKGIVPCEGYHIEKLAFQSAPHVWVSANLYMPNVRPVGGKLAAVLLVCGHDPEGKQAAEYQRACIHLVRGGMAVLAMDSYGQGERAGYYDEVNGIERLGRCTREHDYVGFQCMLLGDSVAKYLLRDAMAGIDYLAARPDIDETKIGVTGNSGGGTLTMMLMMTDSRVAAAAPGTFVTSRKAYLRSGQPQDNEQIWFGLTAAGIDHRDGVLCMAPKPVLLLTAEHDFFPRKGTEETYAWCRKIWALYGREDQLQLYRDDCMHTYSEGMAVQTTAFFRKVFQITEEPIADIPVKMQSSRDLWCTDTGYLLNEKKGYGIFEQNREKYHEVLKQRSSKQKAEATSFLYEKVFKNRSTKELYMRKTRKTEAVTDLFCDSYVWESQDGVINHGYLFWQQDGLKPLTIALWRDGCRRVSDHYKWIRNICKSGRAVLVLDVTGIGMLEQRQFLAWTEKEGFYGARFKLNADMLWLDDSLMALGCYDLLRSLDVAEILPNVDSSDIRLFTCGKYSLYGDMAALLDERIRGIDYEDPQQSFGEAVEEKYYDSTDMAAFVIPGILKYGDIEDIRKWRQENESNRE